MFYGKMAESNGMTTDQQEPHDKLKIEIPDVTFEAFSNLIDFLYSDMNCDVVRIDDDVVMHTLYAAKKYDIMPLVLACVRYLSSCITSNNVLCLLAQARLFEEQFLSRKCLEFIDAHTDEAMQSDGIREIDHDTLCAVLSRKELDPSSEFILYKAAQIWSEAECVRQGLEVSGENQRAVLGPALRLIRFPLMNIHEFGEAASSSILTYEEIAQVFLYLTVESRPSVPFFTSLRCNGRSKHVVHRFPSLSGKRCNRRESRVCLSVDREILVSGFGVYGLVPITKPHLVFVDPTAALDWQATIEITLCPYNESRDISLTSALPRATETVQIKSVMGDTNPIVASFEKPIPIPPNTVYIAGIRFMSDSIIQTYAGKDGQRVQTVDLPFGEKVSFTFSTYKNGFGNEDFSRCEGQLPDIHFLVQWPDDNLAV
ncbi:hypothetical protein AB6A40_005870 [Gnathostoma spinigerum]|uniref:BACK domain-containing protein n=1 Tax=Gnathostoma spinigerum TaxID=75299 RepID=A0ABD6EHG3_9BILA